ncbi:MAG: hypothetical protein JJLCMIEE_00558 [Acidimicrobiales bacterium]|nr:hypothetical protein [Acidimicrobiales bacterium]
MSILQSFSLIFIYSLATVAPAARSRGAERSVAVGEGAPIAPPRRAGPVGPVG